MYRDAHLCAQHRLPDGTALHRLLLQGGKLSCPVLGAGQPGRHSSQKLFQRSLQARVVLRRVFRGEHQHHIAGVCILALQLCAAQSICQRCAGAAKGGGVQRKLHRLLLCPGNCQRHRTLPRRCGLVQAAAQTFQRRAALHQPPGVVPCQHRIAGIQRLQNEVRGAGRAEQRQRPPHSRFVLHRGIVRQMQIRTAGDHRQGLVGRVAAHGRTLRDGVAVLRQKAQIGAVGVIHQQRHALRPADRRQRRDILYSAQIIRAGDVYAKGGVALLRHRVQSPCQCFGCDGAAAQCTLCLRRRPEPADIKIQQRRRVQQRLVGIAGGQQHRALTVLRCALQRQKQHGTDALR